MSKFRVALAVVLTLLVCGNLPILSDPTPDAEADREPLERIARSLEALVSLQRSTILLQKLALEERKIAPLTVDLRGAQSRVRGQQDEIGQLNEYLAQVEDQLADAVRTGSESHESLTVEKRQIESEIRHKAEQLSSSERLIMELENELVGARRDLALLEARIEEILEGLVP